MAKYNSVEEEQSFSLPWDAELNSKEELSSDSVFFIRSRSEPLPFNHTFDFDDINELVSVELLSQEVGAIDRNGSNSLRSGMVVKTEQRDMDRITVLSMPWNNGGHLPSPNNLNNYQSQPIQHYKMNTHSSDYQINQEQEVEQHDSDEFGDTEMRKEPLSDLILSDGEDLSSENNFSLSKSIHTEKAIQSGSQTQSITGQTICITSSESLSQQVYISSDTISLHFSEGETVGEIEVQNHENDKSLEEGEIRSSSEEGEIQSSSEEEETQSETQDILKKERENSNEIREEVVVYKEVMDNELREPFNDTDRIDCPIVNDTEVETQEEEECEIQKRKDEAQDDPIVNDMEEGIIQYDVIVNYMRDEAQDGKEGEILNNKNLEDGYSSDLLPTPNNSFRVTKDNAIVSHVSSASQSRSDLPSPGIISERGTSMVNQNYNQSLNQLEEPETNIPKREGDQGSNSDQAQRTNIVVNSESQKTLDRLRTYSNRSKRINMEGGVSEQWDSDEESSNSRNKAISLRQSKRIHTLRSTESDLPSRRTFSGSTRHNSKPPRRSPTPESELKGSDFNSSVVCGSEYSSIARTTVYNSWTNLEDQTLRDAIARVGGNVTHIIADHGPNGRLNSNLANRASQNIRNYIKRHNLAQNQPFITAKKPRNLWTDSEVCALEDGMKKYGKNWAKIISDDRAKGGRAVLLNRDNIALKDKARQIYRNLKKLGFGLGTYAILDN